MIKWWRRWRARKRHEKQLALCRKNGHTLDRKGAIQSGRLVDGVAVPTNEPEEFAIFGCKCGYHEVNETTIKAPYTRSWEVGEELKRTASLGDGIQNAEKP